MLKITTRVSKVAKWGCERILKAMSIFVEATNPPKAKTKQAKQISLLYALILVVMAVSQLFTFEDFITLVANFNLPLPDALAFVVAPLLIVCEVFALPFLLRMRLSPAFRGVSMVAGWIVPLKWFFITVWVVSTNQSVETVGFLGTIGNLVPGWWAVLLSTALGILAAWSSWGLWPFSTAKK